MRQKPERTDISFGGILFQHSVSIDSKLLALRHRAGHWGLPKGHSEHDEAPIQTAEREIREETGIEDVSLQSEPTFSQKYTFEDDNTVYHKTVTYFLGMTSQHRVTTQPAEIIEYRWVGLEEARALLVVNGNVNEALEQVREYLQSKHI